MLIGLMGPKGSGKDLCADYLITKHHFEKKSFAEPLKKACKELFFLTEEQVNGTQVQKETPDPRWFNATPRKILQFIGTDLLRENLEKIMPGLGKDIFTHGFKIWYTEELTKNPNLKIVISDIRFRNEFEIVKDLGGMVIRIDRPSVSNSDDLHLSEVEMLSITDYDKLLKNDKEGDINYVYEQLDIYLQ